MHKRRISPEFESENWFMQVIVLASTYLFFLNFLLAAASDNAK